MQFNKAFTMTIDGKAVSALRTFEVLNPATESVVALAPDGSHEALDLAVASARRSLLGWSKTPIAKRQAALLAMAERIQANLEDLKQIFTAEQGKPHAEALGELGGAVGWLQAFSQEDLPIEIIEDSADRRIEIHRTPVGVVGAIVPWNFPILLAFWKIAPALLAGNTVVLKPSPFTPLTTLKIGELLRDVLPPGVFNVISGGDALGPLMTAHPDINKISFTGSTATGRKVMQVASAHLKHLTLELGGNDVAIVLPDVDVPTVVPKLFWGAFLNNAQVCVDIKRMYIHEDIYDEFADAFVEYARSVKVGDGAEQGTLLGPVQNRPQYERVCELIEEAHRTGLNFLCGGEIPQQKGYFIPPVIIDNPPDNARVVVEEAFGPVLPLLKFGDIDDVVARANNSEYGLAGSVWSADLQKAQAIAERLETGTVWINTVHYLSPKTPFAGHKQSGFGAENGREGLLAYTNPKTLVIEKTPVLA